MERELGYGNANTKNAKFFHFTYAAGTEAVIPPTSQLTDGGKVLARSGCVGGVV